MFCNVLEFWYEKYTLTLMGSYGGLLQQPYKNVKSVNTNLSVLINHKTSNL